MGIVLDLLLVAAVILIVVRAVNKGVITTVIEVVAFALAIFLASSAAQPTAEIMYKSFFYKSVQKGINESLPANPATLNYSEKAQIVMDNIPDFAKEYATKVGLDLSTLSSQISKGGFKNDAELYEKLESEIVKPIAVLVLKNIMFFILSIAFAILLRIIVHALCKGLLKFELLATLDKAIGGIIGIAEGVVVVFLLCCLLSYLKPKFENPKIIEAVNDSSIVSMAENFDPMDTITTAAFYAQQLN